ncbi:MAG TPA: hypothetical protein DCG54_05005 [Anaerolineae bacterium]|jgi:regulator of protease activity HflC (stomatin/prohibitin superfamily)|nr:hypothetical protein [Anaerolineae bacterium]
MDEEISFFDRPAVRATIKFVLLLALYFVLGFGIPNSDRAFSGLFWDTVFCMLGLVLWTIFFSQFILPVRKLGDRLAIFDRMMAYFSGFHGPAIFIENGNIRARQDEREKHGPGVLWLDHASAAILRTATRFTRTIGPGVHFTKRDEYVAASVDLHTLTQTVGPNDNENPFTVPKEDENYLRIQDSGLETRGMTRDGIQVIATISVTFSIAAEESGGSDMLYSYNAENVRKVITESMIQGIKTDQPVWSSMPAKMAVDIWREHISRFRLNQLFEIPAGENKTNLQLIAGLLKDRMSMDIVKDLDEFGNFTGRTTPSPESKKLKDMGIKVLGVNVKRIIFPPEIEERLVKKWTTLWEKNAKKEREQIDQERRIREEKGQIDAQIEFANIITSEFQTTLPRNKRHAVYLFTHSTSQSVIRNLGLIKKMPKSDTSALTEIARWLKGNQ